MSKTLSAAKDAPLCCRRPSLVVLRLSRVSRVSRVSPPLSVSRVSRVSPPLVSCVSPPLVSR
eukprot:482758-Pyramimonas_sp.AAC.1